MKLILSFVFLTVCLVVVSSKFCQSEDDCGDDECCAAYSKNLSRKGRCLKLGRARSRCNPPEAKLDYYGGKFVTYCPCQDGLECDVRKNGLGRCKRTGTSEEPDTSSSAPDVTEETDAPDVTEETDAPDVTEDTDAPDGDNPDPVDEGQFGPGGERPRDDDCADWELPC